MCGVVLVIRCLFRCGWVYELVVCSVWCGVMWAVQVGLVCIGWCVVMYDECLWCLVVCAVPGCVL